MNNVHKTAKFAYHSNGSNWETMAQRAMVGHICALFKQDWKAIGDTLQRPCYQSRLDHDKKIRGRKQRTDIGNRTIPPLNLLTADVLRTLSYKRNNFRKRARKVINKAK
jgi:hypothetical protein